MPGNIRQAILSLLTRRDYSERDLLIKLGTKGHDSEEIKLVIAELAQTGLINDRRYTENYIDSRRRKGYGPRRILVELQTHGIDDEVIAELLNIADNAWFTGARNTWQKHFKGMPPKDFKSRVKQIRFLQYRGYTQEQIASVLNTQYEE